MKERLESLEYTETTVPPLRDNEALVDSKSSPLGHHSKLWLTAPTV